MTIYTVPTKKNTSGKQKRGGDFAEPKKIIAIKKSGKEKSGMHFVEMQFCEAKKQNREIQKRGHDVADSDEIFGTN